MKRVEILNRLHSVTLNDDRVRLLMPLYVRLDYDHHAIPEGFVTDFSSVPRLPFVYILLGGRGKEAAVVHDYLYQSGTYDQSTCDGYFYLLLRSKGMDFLSARAFLLGLQLRGYKQYNIYAKQRQEIEKQKLAVADKVVE